MVVLSKLQPIRANRGSRRQGYDVPVSCVPNGTEVQLNLESWEHERLSINTFVIHDTSYYPPSYGYSQFSSYQRLPVNSTTPFMGSPQQQMCVNGPESPLPVNYYPSPPLGCCLSPPPPPPPPPSGPALPVPLGACLSNSLMFGPGLIESYEINCSSEQMYSGNRAGLAVVPVGYYGPPARGYFSPSTSLTTIDECWLKTQLPTCPPPPSHIGNYYSLDANEACYSTQPGRCIVSSPTAFIPSTFSKPWMAEQRDEAVPMEVSSADAVEMAVSEEPTQGPSSSIHVDKPGTSSSDQINLKANKSNCISSTCMQKSFKSRVYPGLNKPRIWSSSPFSLPPKNKNKKFCAFCMTNGETREFYKSHTLKDETGVITICPILRKYECPKCHATGDDAHTVKYCPDNTGSFLNVRPPRKSLRRNSCGVIVGSRFH